MGGRPGPSYGRWVSASELAEYAFCPRAHHYARHPAQAPIAPEAPERRAEGERWHERTLAAEVDLERGGYRRAAWLLGLAVGLLGLLAWLTLGS